MNMAVVTIVNEISEPDYGFVPIGTDRYVQVFQVSVRTEGSEEEFLIVNTYPEPLSQPLCETLSASLCKATVKKVIGFLVADGEGWAHLKTDDREFNIFSLAAAAAVYKAGCGWDESPSIVVKVNDAEVRVSPRFDGNHWVVMSLQ